MEIKDIVEQYFLLGQQEKMIKQRRADLKEQINKVYLADKGPLEMSPEGYNVSYIPRRKHQIDEVELEQVIWDKGLWTRAIKEVLDHDLVEQLYLEGHLTDSDLRPHSNADITWALKVTKVGDDDVQANHESVGEGGGD